MLRLCSVVVEVVVFAEIALAASAVVKLYLKLLLLLLKQISRSSFVISFC